EHPAPAQFEVGEFKRARRALPDGPDLRGGSYVLGARGTEWQSDPGADGRICDCSALPEYRQPGAGISERVRAERDQQHGLAASAELRYVRRGTGAEARG